MKAREECTLSLTTAPTPPLRDPLVVEGLEKLCARLTSVLMQAAGSLGGEFAGQFEAGRRLFESISLESRLAMVMHPLYRYWWVQLMGRIKQPSRGGFGDWLLHLARFLLIPALREGIEEHATFVLPLSTNGELRFPGCPRHVRLPSPMPQRLAVQLARGELRLHLDGRQYSVPAGALTGPRESELLCRRALIPETPIELDAGDEWILGHFHSLNAQEPEYPYPHRDLSPFEPLTAALIETYTASLSLICEVWRDLYYEIIEQVKLVVPFRSEHMIGWADLLFHGAVFIRAVPGDVPFTVERLVHEASHLRLFAMSVVPLHYHQRSELMSSPFRRDPRPVSGLYHAAFVYSRLIEFFAAATRMSSDGRYARRLEEMTPKFRQTASTLLNQANLSPTGRVLLEDMQRRVAAVN